MSDQQLLSLNQFQRKFASEEACHSPTYLHFPFVVDLLIKFLFLSYFIMMCYGVAYHYKICQIAWEYDKG